MTLLLSCFNESFNHFIKSGDGATGASSTLGVAGGAFAGGAGDRVEEVVMVPLEEDTAGPIEEDGVSV